MPGFAPPAPILARALFSCCFRICMQHNALCGSHCHAWYLALGPRRHFQRGCVGTAALRQRRWCGREHKHGPQHAGVRRPGDGMAATTPPTFEPCREPTAPTEVGRFAIRVDLTMSEHLRGSTGEETPTHAKCTNPTLSLSLESQLQTKPQKPQHLARNSVSVSISAHLPVHSVGCECMTTLAVNRNARTPRSRISVFIDSGIDMTNIE